jgi:signal-transduction protein with cAMP-binding, CBS, and nucleotidyltransferase domain
MFVEKMATTARDRLVTVSHDAPLIDAARLLDSTKTDLVVVRGSSGRLSGVITKTDVVRQISRCKGSSCTVAVSAIMTEDVVSCQPTDQVSDIWAIMKERRLKNIPVTDAASVPIGILNARDALQALLTEVEHEEALLRDYVMCVGYR